MIKHHKVLLALLGVMVLLVGGAFVAIQSAPQADESRAGFGTRSAQTERYLAGTLINESQKKRGFSFKYPFTSNGKVYSLSPLTQPIQQKLDLYVKDKKAVVVKGKIRTGETINVSDIALIPNSQDINTTGTLTKRTNDADWEYTFKTTDGTEYRANATGAVSAAISSVLSKNVQLKGVTYTYQFTKESFSGLYISEATAVSESKTVTPSPTSTASASPSPSPTTSATTTPTATPTATPTVEATP